MSPEGEILTKRGVYAALEDKEGLGFPWKEETVRDADKALEVLAEEPVLLAFIDKTDKDTQQQILQVCIIKPLTYYTFNSLFSLSLSLSLSF